MSDQSDEYYIEQTLAGNVNAFAHLVKNYQQMVFTLAVRIVKSREEAEEVSQDVFVKAYNGLSKFKGDSKFSTWIYKIAYYASLDVVKKKKRQINSEHIDKMNEGNLGIEQNAVDYIESNERKEIIKKALSKLPEAERVILTLYYFEEIPVKEISEIVNLSQDNVKVKLFRSRKKLYSILENVIEPNTINLR